MFHRLTSVKATWIQLLWSKCAQLFSPPCVSWKHAHSETKSANSRFYSPESCCRLIRKTCACVNRTNTPPFHRNVSTKPTIRRLQSSFFLCRRSEESLLRRCYYHGRGREAVQGVPVPQTGKLSRKLGGSFTAAVLSLLH